ncbi:hypothetical protein FVQ98_00755 [Ottowia sp. GY511]|uniref:Wadjet protein JetD C-terminal domain-containing protein n=1 Tax=Ottowia flava TaxID=2675430 RepID=A0ABW4KUD5_9BURK|nr:hypothetical protein [Ottowia sp. GY511]TXK33441.1 hypothetical protein FVQ98_00755 [Ottowia sp. GY511]
MDTSESSSLSNPPQPHPFLLRLARLLLAKAERSTAEGPVRLPLDRKAAPELHDAVDADQILLLRMQLDDLCATGWVALLLEAPRAFASFSDRRPRLELCDFGALAAWARYTPQAQRWRQQWRAHLAAHWTANPMEAPADPAAVLDHLARSPLIPMEGLPVEEATRSLAILTTLCQSGQAMALREASARAFQGRSKVLDHREELLRLLGATSSQFAEAPIQLLLAPPHWSPTGGTNDGGRAFQDVLFIENLVTFEHMADTRASAWANSLLVYAAGFRGSGRRLRSRAGCRLYLRTSAPPIARHQIEAWLFQSGEGGRDDPPVVPMSFFGDLDHSGMQILATLREVFPQLGAWRTGYGQLVRLLEAGAGHFPEWAAKAKQTDPGHTGCPYADNVLLPILRSEGRFVDQEAFDLQVADGSS